MKMKKKKSFKVLAIETSCDETAAAVVESRVSNKESGIKILSNVVSSQINLHRLTGGVVPEVAARAHVEKIIPVISKALLEARIQPEKIDIIAVTTGPGLIGSLLVGVNAAKTLAFVWNKPIIGIDHIRAHIYANFIGINSKPIPYRRSPVALPLFPALCLVVSGGHTSLILMRDHENFKTVGETLDDAAGEAFDKAAAILGLSYPGGPAIAAEAAKFSMAKSKFQTNSKLQNFKKTSTTKPLLSIIFPRPMINSPDFNFSFSGLKTALLYTVRDLKKIREREKAMLAAEFQQAIVDVLVKKTIRAAERYKAKSILLGGGVAANSLLRQELVLNVKSEKLKTKIFLPEAKLCTDNAAIVGTNACFCWEKAKKLDWRFLVSNPNLGL